MTFRGLQFALRTLVLLLTVAFATSGFAHRLSSAPDLQAEIVAATYGSGAADLCGGTGTKGKGAGCQACRLLASFHLPPAEIGPIRLILAPVRASVGKPVPRLSTLALDTARPARAPPAV